MNEEKHMQQCISLAEKGKGHVSPNPLVGCVIVKNDEVIAEGYHHAFGEKHAEIDALDKVTGGAKGATLYVNLEPCCFHGKTPPCTERIIKEGIAEVVIGVRDPNPGVAGKGISELKNSEIKVREGILEDECRVLNQFFFKWIATGLPYVTLKIAQTSDGFVAKEKCEKTIITNLESRTEVHRLRAWYDAVLIGKGTAIADKPLLNVRHVEGRDPKKIILDVEGELAKKVPIKNNRFDLKELLKELAKQNISSVLVEGGPTVWQSFLNENLADQVIIFTSSKEFGKGVPVLPEGDLKKLTYKKSLRKRFDDDVMLQGFLKFY
ncbi:bifunctional diaminohydroxyphosphoribosylaminopyrimidine deaminase/5-amino-6-(5-phosphoribosylamino)uracil reductase RibD [Patescibacteria group bacterium]